MQNKIKLSDFQVTLQHKVTSKGIRFTHFKKPNAPISIKICSRSGSRFDTKDKSGLAHFLEHIVLDGTEKYPNKKDLSLSFDDLGALYSGFTGPEYARFDFLIAKKEQLGFISDVADQIFNHPLIQDKDIENEKKIIKTEISSKLDNNKRVLSNNIKKLMYGENPLAFNISGTEESIVTIGKDDIIDQLKNNFPHDMTIVSCGSCEIDEIAELFEPVLPCKSQKLSMETPKIADGSKYGSYKMEDQKLIYCMFAFPTCDFSSKDNIALDVISTFLGKGRASLLNEILRYDEGLLYSVTSGNNRFSDTGYFYIEMGIKKENLAIVFNKIKETIGSLTKNGISNDALSIIKNKIINSGIISTQTVQFWTETQFYRELLIKNNNYFYTDFLNDISVIKKDGIDRIINKYITLDNMYFYAVGNVEDKEVTDLFNSTA